MNPYRRTPQAPDLLIVARAAEVTAVHRRNGSVQWSTSLIDSGAGPTALLITDQLVFASASAGNVVALEYETGAVRWQGATGGVGEATLLMEDELLYVCKGGVVDCFDIAGQRLWTRHLPEGDVAVRWSLGFPGTVAGS